MEDDEFLKTGSLSHTHTQITHIYSSESGPKVSKR